MSGITLSASVRQNLLSLQSTASLLATTQNDLATGNKVNSALDNPTSFFTAQGLNNRASDINNLLDQIGNGVQVLQAANTGITSLQSRLPRAIRRSPRSPALPSPARRPKTCSVAAPLLRSPKRASRPSTSRVPEARLSLLQLMVPQPRPLRSMQQLLRHTTRPTPLTPVLRSSTPTA
jgi:hypothetical protein